MALSPNIPIELTSFVGRKREIADVMRLIGSSRLLTLTGTAGSGKTRLALRVAAEVSDQYVDSVHWVELAQLTDPNLVPKAVAKKLNVAERPDRPLVDGILDALHGKKLLLVLDNCEHMVNACARLVETLITLPDISILTTSREALGAPGEIIYPLSPMAAPPVSLSMDDVVQFDAMQLYIERARAIVPRFTLTPENIGLVASVCRQLDGIPLAIELASARINVLTVEQIDARLNDRFKLLGEAVHVTSSHHRSLRAALDWSYDLLISPEQAVLRRLSVFAGGCSLATAEAVCTGEGVEREQVLDLLASLISKSLVVAQTLQQGEARYSLLETIRQYAHEKLISSSEWSAIRDRHLQCFIQLTEETLPKLSSPYQQLWLNWLESEYDNIRATLTWAVGGDRIEDGLRIAVAIYQFWTIRDYAEEGLMWLERLLAQANGRIAPVVHANALAYAVFLAGFRGNTSAQIKYGGKAALLAEALGDEEREALRWALAAQAYAAQAAGDNQTQYSINNRVIQLDRELEDIYQLGLILSLNSFTALSLGKYDEAHVMLDEALPLLREVGNPYRIAMALNFLGDLRRCEQNYSGAQTAYEESISYLRQLDAPRDLASALQNLGHTCLHRDDVARAHALFSEDMNIQLAQHNTPGISECLIGFAALAIEHDLPVAGARLLSAAVAIGGQRIVSTWAATKMEYEHYLSLVRARLTEREFQAEQVAGQLFTLEQAVEYAQHLSLKTAASHTARQSPGALTSRELEIAALIALGKSNGEIADELVVSKRTIEKHIAHIIIKLGVKNRAQIVRWAIETGLVKPTQ
jgi:predicted ATPase/DNA-binding CsgD family transcriptional regulator